MSCYPAITSNTRNGLDTPLSAELRKRREDQMAAAESDQWWRSLTPAEREAQEVEFNHQEEEQ
jgi:hypothetical protein